MARIAQHTVASLLDPAMTLVAQGGLNGLSFRSLAQAVGISVSSITNQASTKIQLIEALVDEARRRDHLHCAPVLELAAASAPLSGDTLAEFADVQLEHWALLAPLEQIWWSELIQAAATQTDIAQILAPWLAEQRAFWLALSMATRRDDAALLAQALFAASIDERAHGTALQPLAAYRRLRRLGLGRLCHMDFAGRSKIARPGLFDHLVARLGEIEDPLKIDKEHTGAADIRQIELAVAAARVLAWDGASELTHRAVAARANVPVSTLAYHFRTSEDLLKGAMQAIILGLKNAMFVPDAEPLFGTGSSPGYFIARSTFTLALHASRSPQLLASAADMRRKRGVNLVHVLNANRPPDRKLDALGAQVLSIAASGAMLAEASRGVDAATTTASALVDDLLAAQT